MQAEHFFDIENAIRQAHRVDDAARERGDIPRGLLIAIRPIRTQDGKHPRGGHVDLVLALRAQAAATAQTNAHRLPIGVRVMRRQFGLEPVPLHLILYLRAGGLRANAPRAHHDHHGRDSELLGEPDLIHRRIRIEARDGHTGAARRVPVLIFDADRLRLNFARVRQIAKPLRKKHVHLKNRCERARRRGGEFAGPLAVDGAAREPHPRGQRHARLKRSRRYRDRATVIRGNRALDV
ncbi:hypothetical protein D3C87_1373160 [compost metagenome]